MVAMLVLSRKAGEAIVLAGTVTVYVLGIEHDRVKIGVDAPPDVLVLRSELVPQERRAADDADGEPRASNPRRLRLHRSNTLAPAATHTRMPCSLATRVSVGSRFTTMPTSETVSLRNREAVRYARRLLFGFTMPGWAGRQLRRT